MARPSDRPSEVLRVALLGALRFGKPLVIDFIDMELLWESICERFDEIQPGLLVRILNGSIKVMHHPDVRCE